MLDQDVVDLSWVDVHARRDDEVGAAIGEEEESVLVDEAHVAEREVLAAVRGGRLVAVLVVLEAARRWRSQVDEANLAGRQRVAVVVADLDLLPRLDLAYGARLRQPRL